MGTKSELTSFLMDFTFKTNVDDLLLGVTGPVGLCTEESLPHMRLIDNLSNEF